MHLDMDPYIAEDFGPDDEEDQSKTVWIRKLRTIYSGCHNIFRVECRRHLEKRHIFCEVLKGCDGMPL
jgi:hypothetical protein